MQAIEMSHSMGSPRTSDLFENLELLQGGSENAEYRPLGHAEQNLGDDDDLEEFDVSERPRPKFWSRRWFWWVGLVCLVIVGLGVAAVILRWVAPLFLEKVTSPAQYSETFSCKMQLSRFLVNFAALTPSLKPREELNLVKGVCPSVSS
jgi:hypothetical protein